MDRVEPVVAVEALDGEVPRVAVAAVNLDREAVGLLAELRGPGLGDRRENVEQQRGPLPFILLSRRRHVVEIARAGQAERERALDDGLLLEQHALHVGVPDDGHGRLRRIPVIDRPALVPLLGVADRLHVARIADHGAADADRDPRLVHHVEHAGEAPVGSTDQVCLARAVLAEAQQAIRDRAVAHLVIEAGHGDVVGGTERTVGLHADLGHDEERDSLHTGRRVGEFREDQVHDVLPRCPGRRPQIHILLPESR